MSVATKSMTHFNSAAEQAISLIKSERGLADTLFLALVALSDEVEDSKNLLTEFDKYMIDAENHVRDSLDEGETLSDACGAWRVRKSELRGAIKAKLDPKKYPSYKAMMNALRAKRNEEKSGSGKGGGAPNNKSGGSGGSGGDTSSAVTIGKLHSVTSTLSESVKEKLNLIAKHLEKLDEATALQVLQDCDGAIHKLAKVGARFSNAKRKTG